MALYDHLRAYYELVFPTRKEVIDFLEHQFAQDGLLQIIDAACGTGGQALALAERGYNLLALDLHEAMVEAGRNKARAMEIPSAGEVLSSGTVRFEVMDMTRLRLFPTEPWQGLYCIGNSLPHLIEEGQVEKTLQNWRENLTSQHKTLIIQIVNFSKIFNEGGEFPLLTGQKDDVKVTFERRYEEKESNLISFITHLKIEKGEEEKTYRDETTLRPLTKGFLQEHLQRLGYNDLQWYGDVTGKPFHPEESPAIVVVARIKR
ncbi:class I SAM-dependent methyltransferase [Heliorestis convoluta]|uniref:Class I SAM-dependent methyltransferase n=1 Tax=Heliorestis convoluta TaxID=356322 RepID=A0A5Q2MZZ2_9FIRM|nr:class I SAM-dependent methyltransferase [Heliorestis convoluta]QGG47033.1 class I SAM-dependent methyltransferase [Heliorestis convoluta]